MASCGTSRRCPEGDRVLRIEYKRNCRQTADMERTV